MLKKYKLLKGYYIVHGYPNYAINKSGKVYNIKKKVHLDGNTNPAGYVNFRLTDSSGNTTTMGRHVLLKRTFDYFKGCEDYVVDHKNGVKGDDRLSNLVWKTQRDNLKAAGELGLSPKFKAIIVTKENDKNYKKTYDSLKKCAEDFNVTPEAISSRCKNDKYYNGYKFKFKKE